VTIVIVEDDLGHARLIERSLRRAHITNDLVILRDGQAALDYLYPATSVTEAHPDLSCLIVLDLSLPIVDGYQVLERVKGDERTRHIPVMIVTAVEEPAEIDRCYALGCSVSITKPVEHTAFVDALRQLGLFLSIVQLPAGAQQVSSL
jgi:CheY-like chemotaxis protein